MFKTLMRVLGGAGSGNFGHAGRAGERGGSSIGAGGTDATNFIDDEEEQMRKIDSSVESMISDGTGAPGVQKFDALVHISSVLQSAIDVPLSQKRSHRYAYSVVDGDVVAAGHLKMSGKEAEIVNLGSTKAGAGSAVLTQLLRDAKEMGVEKVHLTSTARGFYEKMGFELVSGSRMERSLKTLGSATSGNFGHVGRKGMRGGSAKAGEAVATEVHGRALDGSERQMTIGEWDDLHRGPEKSPGGNHYIMSPSSAKSQAVKNITARLQGKEEKIAALATVLGRFSVNGAKATIQTDHIVNDLIKNWATTSADHNVVSLALQRAAADEFGSHSTQFQKYVEAVLPPHDHSTATPEKWKQWTSPEVQEGLRTVLRAQYEETQEFLKEKGVEKIVLFRGFTAKESQASVFLGHDKTMIQNPMSSWAHAASVAIGFSTSAGTDRGIIFAAEFDRKDILAMPGHGMGCLDENEFVVKGGMFKASGVDAGSYDTRRWNNREKQTEVAIHTELAKTYRSDVKQNEDEDIPYIDAEEHNADWIDRSKDVMLPDDELKAKETLSTTPPKHNTPHLHRLTVNEFLPPSLPMASVVLSVVRSEVKALGSSASGNFGHVGRKGMRGGSAKRGEEMVAEPVQEPAKPADPRQVWSDKVSSAYGEWAVARQKKEDWDKYTSSISKAHDKAGGEMSGPEYEAWTATHPGTPMYNEVHDTLKKAGQELQKAMSDGPADSSYSRNNPNQTEVMTGSALFNPLDVTDMRSEVLADWSLTGENQVLLGAIAGEMYGRDMKEDWSKVVALDATTTQFGRYHSPVEDTPYLIKHGIAAAKTELREGKGPEELRDAEKRIQKLDDRIWTETSETRMQTKKEKDDLTTQYHEYLKTRAGEIANERAQKEISDRLTRFYDPSIRNKEAQAKIFMSIKKEAEETLPKGEVKVYRGVHISDAKQQFIKAEIEKNGFFDLPVPPVQSYTRQASLANQFAKYGQTGGKGMYAEEREKLRGMVIEATVPAKDVWMHDRQPYWKEFMDRTKMTFYIGGKDQKEVVVGHPEPTIRLTKENVKWI